MDLSPGRIGQIGTAVHDLDRAIAFYRDALGLRFLFQAPPKMAFFDCGGIRLMLAVPDKPEFDHPGSILYFKVEGIQETYRTLVERGVTFEGEPHLVARLDTHDLWLAFFRDPDQNVLALMSEVTR